MANPNPKPNAKMLPTVTVTPNSGKGKGKPQPKPFKAKTPIGRDLKSADDYLEKNYPGLTNSSTYKSIKSGVKSLATSLGFKKGGTVKTKKKKK